jgi:DNA excision repair protein ERCC-4
LLKRIKKGNMIYTQQLSILSSLPGIGDKLAVRMLQKFRTPQSALNASVAELARIPGFGTARAEKMRKILDNPHIDDIELTQKTLLDGLDQIKSTKNNSDR